MGDPRFYKLLEEMRRIHDAKNSDYSRADDHLSNFRMCENFGIPSWLGVMVRISDKFSRIARLSSKMMEGKEAEVKDESIEDTLIDLANYCLIAVVLLEERSRNTS